MARVQLLDCTLRDGGYYNDWNFAPGLVRRYLQALDAARVSAIEIGFRFLPQDRFLGPFAYSTDRYLRTLPLPAGATIGVMVNAKELLGFPGGPARAVEALFDDAARSPVSLVRVAAHFADLAGCDAITSRLKALGYRVAVNLMQAAGRTHDELRAAAATVHGWGTVDLLYMADSLGNMTPQSVRGAVEALRRGWPGPLGVHPHNNMQQALANALAAIDAGAAWVDSCILGMGRGAGNAQTEYLLLELVERGLGDYFPDAVFALAMEDFEQLRREHGWGANLLYYLSGMYGIHPTYVQEMLGRGHYDTHTIISALESLKRAGVSSYDTGSLEQAMLTHNGRDEGRWSASRWIDNRDLLVIAPGPSIKQHLEGLCQFIDRALPMVVSLNLNPGFPSEKVSAYAACHRAQLLMDAQQYGSLQKPLITPLGSVPDVVQRRLERVQVLDYGMRLQPDTFAVTPTSCTIPASLVAAYVLALGEAAGARRLLLAGFDGYGASHPRQAEMAHVLRCYRGRATALPLLAVTPSTYDVPKGSVYSPGL